MNGNSFFKLDPDGHIISAIPVPDEAIAGAAVSQDGTIYYSTEAVYRPDPSTYSEVLVQPSALRKLSPDGSVRTLLTLNDPSPMGGTYVPSFVNFVATDASGNLYALSYNQQIQVGSYSFLYPFTV